MATYDTEDLLDSVLKIMVNGGALNAKIAAIDAEKVLKGKSLATAMLAIPDDGYYEQTWNNKILNNPVGILYGIENVSTFDGGGALGKNYTIFVEVVYTDSGQNNDSNKRIARYSRALEELFIQHLNDVAEIKNIKIESVRPIAFKMQIDDSEEIKVGGISLTITLY